MFQILLFTLSDLIDLANLIKLFWPDISGDSCLVDWFSKVLSRVLCNKDVKSFVKTCIPVNLFYVISFFFQKYFNWFTVIT